MEKRFVSEERIRVFKKCGYTLSQICDILNNDEEPFIPTTDQSRKESLVQQGYDDAEIQTILDMDSEEY